MPIKTSYDPESNVVYERGIGVVNNRDFEDQYQELLELPLKPGFKNLADYRDVTIDLTSDNVWHIKRMADDVARKSGGAKTAIVVDDDLAYGMSRMFTMTSELESLEVSVFKTMAEACAWLGIEEPEGDIM